MCIIIPSIVEMWDPCVNYIICAPRAGVKPKTVQTDTQPSITAVATATYSSQLQAQGPPANLIWYSFLSRLRFLSGRKL